MLEMERDSFLMATCICLSSCQELLMRQYEVRLRRKLPSGEDWYWMPIDPEPALADCGHLPAGTHAVVNGVQLRYLIDRYIHGDRKLICGLATLFPIYIESDGIGMDIVRLLSAAERVAESRYYPGEHDPRQMLPEPEFLVRRHEAWAKAAAKSFNCELDGPRPLWVTEMVRKMPPATP